LLSELLSTERVRVPLGSHSRPELFRELVRLALAEADDETVDGVVSAVEAREAQGSTAIGRGLAVPHGRTDLVSEVRMSAGIVHEMPDYRGSDGKPVAVAFLVLTPQLEMGKHVKALARIARLMHSAAHRAALLSSPTADEFVACVRRSEPP
jgi:PTS system nitrogen regulatory IIA component